MTNEVKREPQEGSHGKTEGTPGEVFSAFLKLGVTSFGGPIAHLGYFRDELVQRRQWVSEERYADLVALCQFLPGPASSQVGFALGLLRAGPLGALAAFTAFTLPSALILIAFAYGADAFGGPVGLGLIHGLKLVAVAVVAQAVWGMAQNLCPDKERAAIAVISVFVVTFLATAGGQILAIIFGVVAGFVLLRDPSDSGESHMRFPVSVTAAGISFAVFLLLLIGVPLVAGGSSDTALSVFDGFYRAGALVFGGGHVVLPLLQTEVVSTGWLSSESFLAGYGAAQAMPGPLFTFASYLGAAMSEPIGGLLGALVATLAVFLPGFLLLIAALPFWNTIGARPDARAAMRGANAAVVGILGAALYNPVWTSAVLSPADFAVALAGFILLVRWKLAPWIVVVLLGGAGIAMKLLLG
ncbi:chromate efflux transporter [Pseudovibrio exalbescens]|uniref:chromate efflux transporter n=1 Tax=Pseudovibrio exalbescens TaxID=197461 RepID=UPI0023659CC5|nr:chromate efflux transporter [Pseudovibrio exalbescens]MDD7910478.1 chromate efflux transporter [Pseudovibrio exalbescens]